MNWLQGIEEREKKATEKPWEDVKWDKASVRSTRLRQNTKTGWIALTEWNLPIGDATFIAHARTDIPDLLKFIAEALPVMERLKGDTCWDRFTSSDPVFCGRCPPCLARAWIAKHGKESL